MFSVVFNRPAKSSEKTSDKIREKTREKIIKLIRENNRITTADLAANTGISVKGVEYHLSKLKVEKKIKREGPDKGGSWVLIER